MPRSRSENSSASTRTPALTRRGTCEPRAASRVARTPFWSRKTVTSRPRPRRAVAVSATKPVSVDSKGSRDSMKTYCPSVMSPPPGGSAPPLLVIVLEHPFDDSADALGVPEPLLLSRPDPLHGAVQPAGGIASDPHDEGQDGKGSRGAHAADCDATPSTGRDRSVNAGWRRLTGSARGC